MIARCFLHLLIWRTIIVGTSGLTITSNLPGTRNPHVSLYAVNDQENRAYVPDGLTPEEYAKIKQKEQKEMEKQNFGAWGPRFQRTARPDGDWFVLPTLWTGGFQANNNIEDKTQPPANSPSSQRLLRLRTILRNNGPSFLIAYILIDVVVSSLALLRASKMNVTDAFQIAVRYMIWRNRLEQSALVLWNLQLVKIMIAGFLAYPTRALLDRANQRWSWSSRRTIITAVAFLLCSSVPWGVLLLLTGKVV